MHGGDEPFDKFMSMCCWGLTLTAEKKTVVKFCETNPHLIGQSLRAANVIDIRYPEGPGNSRPMANSQPVIKNNQSPGGKGKGMPKGQGKGRY